MNGEIYYCTTDINGKRGGARILLLENRSKRMVCKEGERC